MVAQLFDSADFEVLLPGVYTAREQPLFGKYLGENQALTKRGCLDVHAPAAGALRADTPGLVPSLPADTPGLVTSLPVAEDMVRYSFGPADAWDAPEWIRRPAHYYTDSDWEFIIGVWSRERRQGGVPLYWEDVKVGDEPAWTADGPIDDAVMPTAPFGQGTGGTRTLKKEIMDPAKRRLLIRGEADGIYRTPRREDYAPPIPGHSGTTTIVPVFEEDGAVDTRDIHRAVASARAPLINFYGRDVAIRHLNNWMGDHGWLQNIRWGLMPASTMAAYGRLVPVNPDSVRFLDPVPGMRGRDADAHGLTRDLALVKSYVYDKYVRDGDFLVELAWWTEAITGHIWLTGGATVKLPSKRAA